MYTSADHDIPCGKACITAHAGKALQPLLRTLAKWLILSPSLLLSFFQNLLGLVCLDKQSAASVTLPLIQEVGTS